MNNYVSIFGLELNINPVAFDIGTKEVYWYGIIIAFALVMGYLISSYIAKKDSVSQDTVLDIVVFGAPAAIVCARLYYVIFSFSEYRQNPIKIFAIWEGGIAIYGAVIGAAVTAYIYCRAKKLDWKKVFDVCIIGVISGQAIGRWGNFVNKEAYGFQTSLPWKMGIFENGELIFVHPTFLYESLWNLIGVFILLFINKNKKFSGLTFYSYLIWYGLGRFFIEGLRTDSLYLGPFRISQLVALATLLLGVIFIFYDLKNKPKLNK
ncbi:MAG: prolipoprotein diacylglyceryl transferase [Clostridia bacterium]|nr:prolipoprotein diacylglyceryl transferase [Clostridia bacterium]